MKRIIVISAIAILLGAPMARARPPQAFSSAALAAAQSAGKPVVIHVTAPWCSTCTAQRPIVKSILSEPKFKDVAVLDLDFDTGKPTLRRLRVQSQSTFVAFRGRREVGRSTGETDRAAIEALFDKTT